MKLQLTKDKTIEVHLPWEKPGGAVAGGTKSRSAGPGEMTAVMVNGGDARGCPAVRLLRRKDGIHLVAAGFVPPPKHSLPMSWDESKTETTWELPSAFQCQQAALVVASSQMVIRQTTQDALANVEKPAAAAPAVKKKLGVKRNAEEKKSEANAPAARSEPIAPFVPTSRDGLRMVVAPLAETPFLLQTGLPEYQVLWLSQLLPEGKRPTACSVQTLPAAMLAALRMQPDFLAADGSAMAVFVTAGATYFAGYRQGELSLFRECPGAGGYEAMREQVRAGLGVEAEIVDSILEDTLIDPSPVLEPMVRPILNQLKLSMDYLAQRHDLHVDKVFLMGLPAGSGYWSRFAQETLGIPFVSPEVFEGLVKSTKHDALPADLTPASSQVFLGAVGAALAAMEVGA